MFFAQQAGKVTCGVDKEPGQNGKVIGGVKSIRRQAEPRRKIIGVQVLRQAALPIAEADIAVAEVFESKKQNKTGN